MHVSTVFHRVHIRLKIKAPKFKTTQLKLLKSQDSIGYTANIPYNAYMKKKKFDKKDYLIFAQGLLCLSLMIYIFQNSKQQAAKANESQELSKQNRSLQASNDTLKNLQKLSGLKVGKLEGEVKRLKAQLAGTAMGKMQSKMQNKNDRQAREIKELQKQNSNLEDKLYMLESNLADAKSKSSSVNNWKKEYDELMQKYKSTLNKMSASSSQKLRKTYTQRSWKPSTKPTQRSWKPSGYKPKKYIPEPLPKLVSKTTKSYSPPSKAKTLRSPSSIKDESDWGNYDY